MGHFDVIRPAVARIVPYIAVLSIGFAVGALVGTAARGVITLPSQATTDGTTVALTAPPPTGGGPGARPQFSYKLSSQSVGEAGGWDSRHPEGATPSRACGVSAAPADRPRLAGAERGIRHRRTLCPPPHGAPRATPVFSAGSPSILDLVEQAWGKNVRAAILALWAGESACGADLRRGDGGAAAGQFQQHAGHWDRGADWLGVAGLPGWRWPDATADFDKCVHIILANWCRDARQYLAAGDTDELLRRFRLPFDPHRADNDNYLRYIRGKMRKQK